MRKILLPFFVITYFTFSACNENKKPVTFSEDIAKIIFKNCTPCHRPGSAGTFNLLTYDDVKNKARSIALVTKSRFMPPYPADPSYTHFRDEKVLSEEEISRITEWVDNGTPQGDPSKLPSLPVFVESSSFGKPDMIIHMKESFFIKGNNEDHFMMMKIPFELPRDTFIRAIEIVPGNKKLVHHINAHLISYDYNAKKDLSGGKFFVNTETMDKLEAYRELDLQNDDGSYPLLTPSVSNYLPGVEATLYPVGIGGYRVKQKGILLLDNIHYGPSPVDTTDSTTFNIFFAASAPVRPTTEFIIGTSGISEVEPPLMIRPDTVQTFKSHYKLHADLSLLTVNPHMHLLGKSFLAYGVTPGNDTIPLISIPKWDFRWQYFYTFNKIIKLEKGSTIFTEGVYDNTSENPLNPFHPPQIVSERNGSMRTTDEMFQLIITCMPYKTGDENIDLRTKKDF